MPLRFIIGRAGAGKTYRCLTEIAAKEKNNEKKALIYLVPEQASYQMEKKLLSFCKTGGAMFAQVQSFQRLAWQVLQESGGGIYPVLDETGKAIIMRRLLEERRKDITTFARVLERPGFLKELVETVAEFKVYDIAPDKLRECLEKLGAANNEDLNGKLSELLLLYEEYRGYLDKEYLDTDDFLKLLADNLHKVRFFDDAEIWLDGFTGFTPMEYAVLEKLMLCCRRVNVTLCIDGDHLGRRVPETDAFFPPWETYMKLCSLAAKVCVPVEEVVKEEHGKSHRFGSKNELLFLEKNYCADDEGIYSGKAEGIQVVAAANRREEVERAAREIIDLCREKKYRFREIALFIRDFAHYEELLPVIFDDYGIPFFMDKKRAMRHHPLLDLVQGGLEVIERGWNYEPLFRFLKTDIVSISRQEVDVLENYCLAHGIRGSRWTDEEAWTFVRNYTLGEEEREEKLNTEITRVLKRVNRAREKAVKDLRELETACKEAQTASDYGTAIFEMMEKLAVAKKLAQWSDEAEKEGRLEEARLHRQVWNSMMGLLNQLAVVLGEQQLTLKEYSRLFNAGMENVELALIPPGLDQVLVGSLERSRHPEIKAAFILGVNEGVFPARKTKEGLISDDERRILAELKLELAPTGDKQLFAEQHLVYLALTRASEFLWLSYPKADDEGRALSPSSVVRRVCTLFGRQEEEGEGKGIFDSLAFQLRRAVEGEEIEPFWWQVYNRLLEKEEWRKRLAGIVKGLFSADSEENLPSELVTGLYGRVLRTGVSRLERFQACPFAHFLNYGLQLKKRPEYKLTAPDLGQFFHDVLENIYTSLGKNELNLADLAFEQAQEIAEETVDGLAPKLQNEILLSTAKYRYLTNKLKGTVANSLQVLQEHEKRGEFRTLGVELEFGKGKKLSGLKHILPNGAELVLEGRIDRVDFARDGNSCLLRVIDYKSGAISLNLLELYHGLKLQLPIYLDVVLANAPRLVEGQAVPAGMLYFKISNPLVLSQRPPTAEELEKERRRKAKMKGFVLRDERVIRLMDREISGYSELIPAAINRQGKFYKNLDTMLSSKDFQIISEHVKGIVKQAAENIYAGNIEIKPYHFSNRSPCDYCDYRAVCRFDNTMSHQGYRYLSKKTVFEVKKELGLGEGTSDE